MNELKLGIYEHYKGHRYEVIGVARLEEDLSEVVVYKALYEADDFPEGQLWVRPLKIFFETVTVGGKEVPRFKFVEE